MTCAAWSKQYDSMLHNRCGQSGAMLAAVSLGLRHNFADVDGLPSVCIENINALQALERG